jgi:hypothetical protein
MKINELLNYLKDIQIEFGDDLEIVTLTDNYDRIKIADINVEPDKHVVVLKPIVK